MAKRLYDLFTSCETLLAVRSPKALHKTRQLYLQMFFKAKEISQIGGANLYEFISRSCQKLITNQFCGETFSFLGRRRKQPFRNLKLNELLIKASMKQFKQSTIKEVELNISKWLRRCLERGNKQN
uniref:DUF4806 domain-containing protein n=1 Tax=Photinus pyralis TaxID=7054 RepID=A0A1Y1KF52_PHOPY